MNQEASFTFTTPLNINIVEIKGEEHLFVEGDISTNDIDFVDDIMSKKCQESMQKQIIERNMKLDVEHEAFKGSTHEEKEINKTKIPAGKLVDAVVKDLGKERYSTRVKGEINRHNKERYNELKGYLMDKYLDAFSVAFLPREIKHTEKDGKKIRVLDDVTLLNVALTGNPCNTKAQLVDIVVKSMDALEDYKKLKELDPSIEEHLVVKNKINMSMACPKCGHKIMDADVDKKNNKLHSTDLVGKDKLNKDKNFKMTDKDTDPKTPEEGADPTDPVDPATPGEGNESTDAEQKAMLKSVSVEMKSLVEKYDVIAKENVDLKESVGKIAEAVEKITKALEQPIHKSPGVQIGDAEKKANAAEGKSVDPLSVF